MSETMFEQEKVQRGVLKDEERHLSYYLHKRHSLMLEVQLCERGILREEKSSAKIMPGLERDQQVFISSCKRN